MAVSEIRVARTFIRNSRRIDGDDDRRLHQHPLDVLDRGLDEGRLPELDLVGGYTCRQVLLDAVELRLDGPRHADRVGRRLLLDADDDSGSAHEARIAALDARGELDLGDLAQQDAVTLPRGDDQVAQVFEAVRQADVADQVLARVLIDEAAAGVDTEAADGGLHVGGRYFEPAHHHRVRHDAVLAHLAADRNDLGNAGDGEDLRADDEVGDLAQLHRRDRLSRHRDQHDLAHDRGDRPHFRVHAMRQPALDGREALGDLLPGAVDLGLPAELDVDDRQADAGGRANAHDARHAAHGGLDRVGDELLHLLRREPFGLRHQHHRRAVEVGEDIDRKPRQHEAAVGHEHDSRGQDQQPVLQSSR